MRQQRCDDRPLFVGHAGWITFELLPYLGNAAARLASVPGSFSPGPLELSKFSPCADRFDRSDGDQN
jgi:hypothetical protein